MLDIFISYCHEEPDNAFVDSLAHRLSSGSTRVKRDKQIRAGADWAKEIEAWIDRADVFIVVLSRKALESHHVRSEIDQALKRKNGPAGERFLVIPLQLEDVKLPPALRALYESQAIRLRGGGRTAKDESKRLAEEIRRSIAQFVRPPRQPVFRTLPNVDASTRGAGTGEHAVSVAAPSSPTTRDQAVTASDGGPSEWAVLLTIGLVVAIVLGGIVIVYFSAAREMLIDIGLIDKPRFVRIPGRDEGGRLVNFDFAVVSHEYHWRLGSADYVESPGSAPEEYMKYLESRGMQVRLSRHRALIAIGVSSCRGGSAEETARSDERARRLASWLKGVNGKAEIYQLSLGQYASPCPGDREERNQRSIVIVGADKVASDAVLSQALRSALDLTRTGESLKIGVDVTHYSNWPRERFLSAFY